MKIVTCNTCANVIGLIIRDPDRESFIELYREFIVCANGHNDKRVDEYEGDPDIVTPFYQAE